jgi:hypothetical protein
MQRTASDLTFNLEAMKGLDVSLFGWAETNTNWNKPDTQREFRDSSAAARVFNTGKSAFSSSDIPSESKYKPGGTPSITVTGKWCGRAEKAAGQDPSGMGRFSYMILKGKLGTELVTITAFRVSQVSMPKHGDGTTCLPPRAHDHVKE